MLWILLALKQLTYLSDKVFMMKFKNILFVVFAIKVNMLHAQDLNSLFTSNVSNRFIAYVAPWCPACKNLQPVLKAWCSKSKLNQSGEVDFIIVIGEEKKSGDNETLASYYSNCKVFIDKDNSIAKKYDIKNFPSFRKLSSEMTFINSNDQDVVNELSKLLPLRREEIQ